ncbi:MAG: hypothetical protein EOS63_16210 [Mesorhizobium sp.]|uniref:hypothetical protein n=1 Tax=Mesorhizobium sp. TaxID=1871066 RepID=UPI000FE8AC14|nr:hypothetical protein [Mesorhizobium sp.]RWE79237.1 MAG: hypothetical protein EOS63_16210 [Mesorhizobium sp.]TJW61571.1 MAG: hypothetical protein E5V97_20075 [Mesorhizobium sp.]
MSYVAISDAGIDVLVEISHAKKCYRSEYEAIFGDKPQVVLIARQRRLGYLVWVAENKPMDA